MTYSRMRMHTTIGAYAFHFRVRNGIGWDHAAIITRERVEGRGPEHPVAPRSRSVASSGNIASRLRRISRNVANDGSNVDASSSPRPLEVIWSSRTDH